MDFRTEVKAQFMFLRSCLCHYVYFILFIFE